jgi:NMD protein affecting ribosome stability and mRNA decay
MICRCGQKMQCLYVWDDAQETDHAFNVYACDKCGRLLKDDVWNDKGQIWIGLSGVEEGSSNDRPR